MERISFLNTFVDNVSLEEALGRVEAFVSSGTPHQLVALNAAKVVDIQRDTVLCRIVNSSSLIFADGQSIVSASKFLGYVLKERVAGIDLMQEIVRLADKNGYTLYFLGAKQEVVGRLVSIYKKGFPGLRILGWHNGYFKSEDEEINVIKQIKMLKPDIMFVAMPTPKKEYWVREHIKYLGVPVSMGVGGSFDVAAGFIKRAPKWMQRAGLEWLFRLLKEPRSKWKRYLFTNIAFIWLVLKRKFELLRPRKLIIKKTIAGFILFLYLFFTGYSVYAIKEEKWFPFYIPWDYCKGSMVDFSFLLDAPAGKHGFVGARDGHFYFEDGTRARFWGLNLAGRVCFPEHSRAEDAAKRFAQLGCNIVRMHFIDAIEPAGVIDTGYDDSQHLSKSQMEKLDYFIYQLKKNGIYVCFDVLGLGARVYKSGDNVPDFEKIKRLGLRGISFSNKEIIGLSRKFALDFLSHVNQYTGNAYLNEPAIAIVEMTNENTIFSKIFYRNFHPYFEKEIQGLGKERIVKKGISPDNPGSWKDDARFLFELQNEYQKGMYDYLRSIGVKVPIGSSNIPYDNLTLAADSNMDFTDIHAYWDLCDRLDRIHNRPLIMQSPLEECALVNSISIAKVRNRPLVSTEWGSNWPNEWRAVDTLSTACYAALNDWDGLFLFAYAGGSVMRWEDLEGKISNGTKVFSDPAKMGIFPIAGLIFLRGDIRKANDVYGISYSMEDLFNERDLKDDRQRLAGISYVSRFEKEFHASDAGSDEARPSDYSFVKALPIKEKRIISDTGEIIRDSGKGIFILKTPRTFSFSGFVGNLGVCEFDGIKFETQSEFAAITVTSLDGKYIPGSGRLLLTVVGRASNKNQKLAPHITKRYDDLERDVYILDTGDTPIMTEAVDLKVFIEKEKRKRTPRVFLLDEKGVRKSGIVVDGKKDFYSFDVSGHHSTIYYEIIRD